MLGPPALVPIVLQQPIAQQQIQFWQGPYPPPDAVRQYEEILPGSFDRMIKMAEQLQAAQIESARRAQEFQRADTRRGHWLGFAAVLVAMAAAAYCVHVDAPWVAAAFLSVPVMAVAKALVESAWPTVLRPPAPPPAPPQQSTTNDNT